MDDRAAPVPNLLPSEHLAMLTAAWRLGLDTHTIAAALSVLWGRMIPEATIYNALPLLRGGLPACEGALS